MTQSRWSGRSLAPQYAQPPHAARMASHWSAVRSFTTLSTRRLRLLAARALRLLVAAMAEAYATDPRNRGRRLSVPPGRGFDEWAERRAARRSRMPSRAVPAP